MLNLSKPKKGIKKNMVYDQHMHSEFSGDSKADPEVMIKKAKELNLPGITFTDHLDWDYFKEPGLFDLDYSAYIRKVHELQKEHNSETFKINLGIELGLQEHLLVRHKHFFQMVDFDFVIGSIHVVNHVDPYFDDYYKDRDVLRSYVDYFDAVLKNIETFSDFDSLGHLDYIKRYVMRHFGPEVGAINESEHKEAIDAILQFLVKNDKALEVNTGAFRHGLTEPNPSYSIINRYKELGGKLITIGADAHTPEYVGDHFEDVCDHLRELGFTEYAVYEARKPILHLL